MKKDFDFSQCRFINDNMNFITYKDFCDKRTIIKHMFYKLDENGKQFYMWYIYANIHMKETFKNAIWDYLNNYDKEGLELMRLYKIYKPI